jgi:3-oxoacyl-[acyl-carrier protein] reductase
VALTYVSKPDEAQKTVQAALDSGVKALAIQADSADAKAVVAAVERTVQELGGIDILVNNAGIALMGAIDEVPLEDFDRTMAVNVRAVFVATQAAVQHMQAGGRIINIASCNALRAPVPRQSVYTISKAALLGLVKGAARDHRGQPQYRRGLYRLTTPPRWLAGAAVTWPCPCAAGRG